MALVFVHKVSLSVMPDSIRHPDAFEKDWIPAFAGMTPFCKNVVHKQTQMNVKVQNRSIITT